MARNKSTAPKTTPKRKKAPRRSAKSAGAARTRRFRNKQRASGLRLVQMWLPDTSNPAVIADIKRQCELINASSDSERVMDEMLSIADLSGWK
jgi:hypothetical protein